MGDVLDAVLLVALLGFAVSGYRQGFAVGAVSFLGFLGGGFAGAKFAPTVVRSFVHGRTEPLAAILVVFVGAILGQLVVTPVGIALRRRLRWRPAELLDSAAGAVVSILGALMVSWLVGTAVAHSQFRPLARQVQHSTILTAVSRVLPAEAQTWFAAFERIFDRSGFPQVFGGLGAENIVQVAPPDPKVLHTKAVGLAERDVVEIRGQAPSCSREIQGSGFVFTAHHVMTNAHVVAGVKAPTVSLPDGHSFPARVVLYDPQRDVAVLYVPGLDAPALTFASPAAPKADAVVIGYPEGGPFTAVAARVRGRESVRGPNIYETTPVTREIYSLRAQVLPGNSGGPLLTPAGGVLGVVFAASLDDKETGYALTAAEVRPDAQRAGTAAAAVSTRSCTSD